MPVAPPCPCGSGEPYACCCEPLHRGERVAPTAEALMRSRYAAYVLQLEPYLLATWHPDHRPAELELAHDTATRWLGLTVKRHTVLSADTAEVEFVARYRIAGRGHRLHEISRFQRIEGRWVYTDGQLIDDPRGAA